MGAFEAFIVTDTVGHLHLHFQAGRNQVTKIQISSVLFSCFSIEWLRKVEAKFVIQSEPLINLLCSIFGNGKDNAKEMLFAVACDNNGESLVVTGSVS